jgi:hypothetical protein
MSTWRLRRGALAILALVFIVGWPVASTYYFTRRLEAIAEDMAEYQNRIGGRVEIAGPGEGNSIVLRGAMDEHRIYAVGGGPDFVIFALSADPRRCLATLLHTGPDGELVLHAYSVGEEIPSLQGLREVGVLRVVRIVDPLDEEAGCAWDGAGAEADPGAETSAGEETDRLATKRCREGSKHMSRQVLDLAQELVRFEERCQEPVPETCREDLVEMNRKLRAIASA